MFLDFISLTSSTQVNIWLYTLTLSHVNKISLDITMCYKVKLKYTLYQEQYNAPTPTHPIQIGLDPFLQEVYQKFAAHKIFVY